MVSQDPIDIWNIKVLKNNRIKAFGQREGDDISYDEARENIKNGQIYILHDEDGNSSKLVVDKANRISSENDDSKLNNLRGNTNLKVIPVDE